MLKLLADYQTKFKIRTFDISDKPDMAKAQRMFFPTLTVVNGRRYFSPIKRSFLEALCEGKLPHETPYSPLLGKELFTGKILPLTPANYHLVSGCTGWGGIENCEKKRSFLSRCGLDVCGFVTLDADGKLLGGAEFMPSCLVPYDIPKGPKTAFITCVYLSDEKFDYKTVPLKELEKYLGKCYDKVLVVSDKTGVFPNGDKEFFERNGYSDDGVISVEQGYCELHLMSKEL